MGMAVSWSSFMVVFRLFGGLCFMRQDVYV